MASCDAHASFTVRHLRAVGYGHCGQVLVGQSHGDAPSLSQAFARAAYVAQAKHTLHTLNYNAALHLSEHSYNKRPMGIDYRHVQIHSIL